MGLYDNEIMDGVFSTGTATTVLQDGVWCVKDGDRKSFLIADESKLALLTGMAPGSRAHTAWYKKMWELDVDGATWVPV